MKNFSHSIEFSGNNEKIWELWKNVENWNKWDTSIEESQLFGEFNIGTKGIIIPKKGPKINFSITQLEYMKSFSNTSKIPGGKIQFFHRIDKNIITHGFIISGITGWLFGKILGKQISKDIITSLENIQKNA